MSTLGEDLLNIVNRLQDLVFNTIGNDSLDLPQIVSSAKELESCTRRASGAHLLTCSFNLLGRSRLAIIWKVICA